ncbi:MAG: BolA family transcriptional regulator [Comamonadaceae bacterium BICA1-1]|nr:MAG: BolA family transcriptional regulator [Comamonadaceae bacterium BICA1-1]
MNAQELQSLIAAHLDCSHLEVNGDGRHWYAVVVAPAFEGKRLIARHQMVYAAMGERIRRDEVHALSMQTHTPAEWAARQAKAA